MTANLENSAVASLHSNPKEGQCQRTFKFLCNCTFHMLAKLCSKSFKLGFSSMVNLEIPDVQLDLENTVEPEIKLPTSTGSLKKQGNSKKTSTTSLTKLKPLTVLITTKWKIHQDMGIPHHLNCLLRNLYAGQEATVRTRHGTTDWFKIGKGVHQDCNIVTLLI